MCNYIVYSQSLHLFINFLNNSQIFMLSQSNMTCFLKIFKIFWSFTGRRPLLFFQYLTDAVTDTFRQKYKSTCRCMRVISASKMYAFPHTCLPNTMSLSVLHKP